uniref:Cytokine receptor-like factor 2-like D1 domain-containing protein n=1 Tax=Acanthochromis polyacanthus TaxID=80966 RepID=A0A3Q1EJ60_9TELE
KAVQRLLDQEKQIWYVDCLVVHLQHVHCSWNQKRAPEVNYTFSSWFHHEKEKECATYLSENGVITGCYQPYQETKRFNSFYTKLVHGNKTFLKTHELKNKGINGVQSYCINLPSSSSRYELQVRSRVDDTCGQSIFWSDWSEPVVWGSNSHTGKSVSFKYVVGTLTLILLVIILLHHERWIGSFVCHSFGL